MTRYAAHHWVLMGVILLALTQGPGSSETKKPPVPTRARLAKSSQGHQVNLNKASLEQLQTLPGIGPAIARRIITYREKNSPFRRIEELLIIRGISRNKFERLRNQICIE